MIEGIVVFWNGRYGFIDNDGGSSMFFHKSSIDKPGSVGLLSNVSFTTAVRKKGKHQGKLYADSVKKISSPVLSGFKRYAGKIIKWSRYNGLIESPQLEKKITLHATRKLFKSDIFTNGDVIVFSPVKDRKYSNRLFALFAYKLGREEDTAFLQELYGDSQILEVSEHLNKILEANRSRTIEEEFLLNVTKIGFIETLYDYRQLVSVIKEFQSNGFMPRLKHLRQYCPQKFQIQLWEEKVLNEFDRELLCDYFHRSSADAKRNLASNNFPISDRKIVYQFHFSQLKKDGKLNSLNNDVKTLLDLIVRNIETSDDEIAFEVIEYLKGILRPGEMVELWNKRYVANLPDQYIIDHFNVKELIKLDLKGPFITEKKHIIIGIYERYVLDYVQGSSSDDLFELIRNLLHLQKLSTSDYSRLITFLREKLGVDQKFIMLAFGLEELIEDEVIVESCFGAAEEFFKIKFLNGIEEEPNKWMSLKSNLKTYNVNLENLVHFACNYKWNTLLSPTEIEPPSDNYSFSFFHELRQYVLEKDQLRTIADAIYDSVEYCSVVHLRLWLYNYVDDDRFDYIGFRREYVKLTHKEKLRYRNRATVTQRIELEDFEMKEVKPCTSFSEVRPGLKIYDARLENLYFFKSYLVLRREDSSVTMRYKSEKASRGLNRVPLRSELNKIAFAIEVNVNNNEIIDISGLDDLFSRILTRNIEKVLGKVGSPAQGKLHPEDPSYTEDIKLKKQVVDYLNESYEENIPPLEVYEPKSDWRRLDSTSKIDDYELTRLYSFRSSNGIAIVWENIDFTHDRATYIFKCLKENHTSQISKIACAISGYTQFRSTLIKNDEAEELRIFKNDLGFIASIRKQRGKEGAFENWKSKLKSHIEAEPPELPSPDELELLENWDPPFEHPPRPERAGGYGNQSSSSRGYTRKPKSVDTNDIPYSDVSENGIQLDSDQPVRNKRRKKVLEALKEFNEFFNPIG